MSEVNFRMGLGIWVAWAGTEHTCPWGHLGAAPLGQDGLASLHGNGIWQGAGSGNMLEHGLGLLLLGKLLLALLVFL